MKKPTFAKRCTEIAVVVVAIMVLLGLAFFVAGRFLGKRTPALLVCTTEVCSKYADMFDNNINDDVEPCDNFYRHVCAPQVRKQAKATFETLRDNHFIKVWEYLAGVEVPDKGGSALEKAARYLQSCHSVLNITDTQEVKDVLRKGGITWPDPASHSLDLLDGIFYMSARVFKPVFFSVTVKKAQQPPTVELSLDPEFISVLDMVYRRKTTKRLQGHFRLVYADFASPEVAKNETRRSELLNDVDEIGAHFKNVSNYSLSRHKWERAQMKPGDITTLAPSTTYAMWEAAFARYFPDQPFNSVASIVVNHVEYFKAVFQTLAVFGASRMLNYFSWLCVQALVHYTSIEMLSSYYSSMHEAIRNHKKYCVADTYSHFRFAINVHSWQNVPESSLEYVHRLADTIWEAFGKSLQDKGMKLTGHKEPPPKEPFTSKLFQHHTLCKPEKVEAFYSAISDLSEKPLHNHITATKSLDSRTLDPMFADMELVKDLEKSGQLRRFVLKPWNLGPPWFAPDAPHALALGGLGVAMAGVLYFQSVERQGASASATHAANMKCLAPNASYTNPLERNLPGLAVALRVAYEEYKVATRANRSLALDLPPVKSDAVVFAFFCYLMCSQEPAIESLCNIPLQHSPDFSEVYQCKKGSFMNPESKCYLTV